MFSSTINVFVAVFFVHIAAVDFATKRYTRDVPENLNNRNQLNATIDHLLGMSMMMLYRGVNVVSLPMVVRFSLCKLLTVATGPARDHIAKLLDPSTKHVPETLKTCYSSVQNALEFLQMADLVLVNKMYLNYSHDIDPAFERDAARTMGVHVDKVSFAMPVSATNYINHWFEINTFKRTKNILRDGDINANTSILLLSAAHVKLSWEKPFDIRLTKEAPFHGMDGKKSKVMMMSTITSALYYAENTYQMIKMRLRGADMTLTIVLPAMGSILMAINSIGNLESLQRANRNLTRRDIILSLPRIKIRSSVSWEPVLGIMGLEVLFNKTHSGLDKILRSHKNCKSVYLSRVKQNVLFELDEYGTSRTAIDAQKNVAFKTADVGKVDAIALRDAFRDHSLTRPGPNARGAFTDFIVDRPFLFFVDIQLSPFGDHKELLAGAYYGPNSTPEAMERLLNRTLW